jgi:hypothetical protein
MGKRFKNFRREYDNDGERKQKLSRIREDKDRKGRRNLDNAIRSRNLNDLQDFEDLS